jgi:hypothetical protein
MDPGLPDSHIIDAGLGHSAILNRSEELPAPEVTTSWHSHVHTGESRGNTGMLSSPVRHDESLCNVVSISEEASAYSGARTWKPSSVFRRPFRILLFAQPYELFTR